MEKEPLITLVYRLRGTHTVPVDPIIEGGKAAALPDDLLMAPGAYRLGDKVYALEEEGLYRILQPMCGNRQRIVFRDNLDALVSAVCWMHSHGNSNNGKAFVELCRIALTGKLIMTCGDIARFTHNLFGQLGLKSRLCGARQIIEKNAYDSGHSLVEIQQDGRWILLDADQHVFFTGDGRRLSLLDACLRAPSGDYELERLAASAPLAISDFKGVEGYDYGLKAETTMYSEATLRQWYQRIMHIPIMYDSGKSFCTGMPEDKAAIERVWPDLTFITIDEFRAGFYPVESSVSIAE